MGELLEFLITVYLSSAIGFTAFFVLVMRFYGMKSTWFETMIVASLLGITWPLTVMGVIKKHAKTKSGVRLRYPVSSLSEKGRQECRNEEAGEDNNDR